MKLEAFISVGHLLVWIENRIVFRVYLFCVISVHTEI